MAKILITNPLRIATMDDAGTEFAGGHILIEDGVIRSIGPQDLQSDAHETIDATGMVALPGFVNTHHHLYQTLTRNIPRMQQAPLFDWIENYYELWRELTEQGVAISTKTGLLELMKSGASTSSDHLYLFPAQSSPELIDVEIAAAQELGIRFHPTRGSMSLGKSAGGLPPDDLVQSEAVIQQDTERLLAKYHDASAGSMLRLALAPCSPFSVSPELMKTTARFAQDNALNIHTHLAETQDEEEYCLRVFHQRPAEFLESLGWFNQNAWFAHSIHLTAAEIHRLGAAGAGVSHCPSSNMRLGSGIAHIREMLDAGVHVSLGVDGAASNDSSNMLLEIRNAMLLSRLRERANWLTAREVLRMATRGGAAVLGRDDIGQLAVGQQADIALFSLNSIEYAGARSDPVAALVFTVRQSPVDYLLVDGIIRVREGRVDLDETKLREEHDRIGWSMIEKSQARTGIDFMELPAPS